MSLDTHDTLAFSFSVAFDRAQESRTSPSNLGIDIGTSEIRLCIQQGQIRWGSRPVAFVN
jgi:hypothetical protein